LIVNTSYKGIWVEFQRKKQHNIGFPVFKLHTGTYFTTDPFSIILTI